jgi:hypothetical protein
MSYESKSEGFHPFTQSIARHFVNNNNTGVLSNLNESHVQPISHRIAPHSMRLLNHLKDRIGGSYGSPGGSLRTGGSFPTGGKIVGSDEHDIPYSVSSGGYLPAPQTEKEMYHHLLNLTPHQFEAYRETATQMLGGVPSPMWDKITTGHEPLESDASEYENIMRMPNQHAAARLLDADANAPTGGGFFKALKHVGRKVTSLYKMGRGALNFVDRNKDLLLDLPGVRDYKEGISGFLDTAVAIDDVVNPLVDAAIDASRNAATAEDRNRLKKMAEKSIDSAIDTHMPQARKYVDAAKDLNNTVQEVKRRSYNV